MPTYLVARLDDRDLTPLDLHGLDLDAAHARGARLLEHLLRLPPDGRGALEVDGGGARPLSCARAARCMPGRWRLG